MHSYFRRYSDRNKIAVDLGANVGAHTMVLQTLFAEVHSFEMQAPVFELLRRNVRANHAQSRVRLHNVALGRAEGGTGHYCDSTGSARNIGGVSARLSTRVPHRKGCYKLRFTTLDRALSRVNGSIALMKVDVEGFEENVLLGARSILARHRPILMFESFHLPINLTNMLESLRYDTRLARYPEDYIAIPRPLTRVSP